MSVHWYYRTGTSEAVGPVSPAVLKQMANAGLLKPTDLLWHDGWTDWVPASKVRNLFATPKATVSGPAESAPPSPVATAEATRDSRVRPSTSSQDIGPSIREYGTSKFERSGWLVVGTAMLLGGTLLLARSDFCLLPVTLAVFGVGFGCVWQWRRRLRSRVVVHELGFRCIEGRVDRIGRWEEIVDIVERDGIPTVVLADGSTIPLPRTLERSSDLVEWLVRKSGESREGRVSTPGNREASEVARVWEAAKVRISLSTEELSLSMRPNSVSGYEKALSDLGTPFASAETGRRLVHVPWKSIRRLEYGEQDPWIRIEFGTAGRPECVEAVLDDGTQRSEVVEAALDRLGPNWTRRREQRRLGPVLGVLAIAGFVATFAWILYGQAEVAGNGLPPRAADWRSWPFAWLARQLGPTGILLGANLLLGACAYYLYMSIVRPIEIVVAVPRTSRSEE